MSIVPAGEAKTFVNGMHISEPTVLHHVSGRQLLGAASHLHLSYVLPPSH